MTKAEEGPRTETETETEAEAEGPTTEAEGPTTDTETETEGPTTETESPTTETESPTTETEGPTTETEGPAVGAPVGSGGPTELKAPPPVAGNESPEPAVVALVFLLPPLALGGTALGLLLAGGYGWNPLGVGLIVGLVASVVGFAVIRRIFDKG